MKALMLVAALGVTAGLGSLRLDGRLGDGPPQEARARAAVDARQREVLGTLLRVQRAAALAQR
ncbi:hypothetical protein FGE12_18505 [Aggregicoccus sp. 17bor-14]|uniref:hypothetical protein n=1 Tax=Myxococcaceae TaxID=31 RepID=UPI00129C2F46|nr:MULTISPECIES: hypothetical protein [Myxococcaceae]MBF5044397.1 hypothetical protein [Simulacricoccus sp. 17bor-14]MRI90144.1 hypothetical protein [Aggregicoccus sp. 17bor-14]